MTEIDFSKPPDGHQFNVTLERAETPAERGVRLFKDVALFVAAMSFVAIIGWLAVRSLTSAAASPDEKKWAMGVLAATAAGLVGYLIRR